MAGRPRGRAGEHPWRDNPELSDREPFREGNTAAQIHGAQSHRFLRPIADRLEAEIVREAPWVGRPAFAGARRSWAFAEAQCIAYEEWFAANGLFDAKGEPSAGLVRLDRAQGRASMLRAKLGLDPSSLAGLLLKLSGVAAHEGDADGLAEVQAEGRRIVELRERQLAAGDVADEEGEES
jgi:hypothetical protein